MQHVLVVEDDTDLRETTKYVLRRSGFAVSEAAHGAEALECSRRQPYDLILLDLQMPVLDGWAFLRQRRADPALLAVPVVVISGDEVTLRAVVQEFGLRGFLLKPFSAAQVRAAAERWATPPPPATAANPPEGTPAARPPNPSSPSSASAPVAKAATRW